MIALVVYRLPDQPALLHETQWVTPTDGWDAERALRSFQQQNPSALIETFTDVTDR